MKCPYCNAEIVQSTHYCDKCGQPLDRSEIRNGNGDRLNKHDPVTKQHVLNQLSSFRTKVDRVHESILSGYQLKSKRYFSRVMLAVFLLSIILFIVTLFVAIFCESDFSVRMAFSCLGVVLLLLSNVAFAIIVIDGEKGVKKYLVLLIPVFGLLVFFMIIGLGIKQMFSPLDKTEQKLVKELDDNKTNLTFLREEEQNLKSSLLAQNRDVLDEDSLSTFKKVIAVEPNTKKNSWRTATIVSLCLLMGIFIATFVISSKFVPVISKHIYRHSYGNWIIEQEATEDQVGIKAKICNRCGKRYVVEDPKLPHTHKYGSWIIETEATEEHAGLKVKICSKCGYRYEKVLDQLEHVHDYGDWVTVREATEYITGLKTRTCSKCGDQIQQILDRLEHVHDLINDPAVAATCSSNGKTSGVHCSKCGKVLEKPRETPMDHSFENGSCKYCGTTDKPSQGLVMKLNEDQLTYSITGMGVCTDTKVVIPMTYDGLQVTQIMSGAFKDVEHIENAIIPNCIRVIGDNAFKNCAKLESVDIAGSVETIGMYCFKDCTSLETVTFHEGLRTIEGGAFMGTKITSAVIPDSTTAINTHYYTTGYFNDPNYDGAFENCTELVSVTIGKKLAAISRETFQNCTSLATVIIGDGVETIGTYAFAGCTSLTDLTIGSNVTKIETGAFDKCPVNVEL